MLRFSSLFLLAAEIELNSCYVAGNLLCGGPARTSLSKLVLVAPANIIG